MPREKNYLSDYELLDLINLVKLRPCIWDKTSEDYKDCTKKKLAWDEIYLHFCEDYNLLHEDAKLQLADMIIKKWRNLKDAFVRSVKKNSLKRYLLHDQLNFLTKTFETVELNANLSYEDNFEDNKDVLSSVVVYDTSSTSTTSSFKKRLRSHSRELDEEQTCRELEDPIYVPEENEVSKKQKLVLVSEDLSENSLLKTIRSLGQCSQEIDEDDAFFVSIKPHLKKFTEDEKLEFRMEVLSIVQNIKKKRQNIHC